MGDERLALLREQRDESLLPGDEVVDDGGLAVEEVSDAALSVEGWNGEARPFQ